MNTIKNMIIKHCIRCDVTMEWNHFQEWLAILKAGTTVKIDSEKPYLDMEYIQEGLDCESCLRNEMGETVIMVVFKWSSEV